MAGGSSKVIVGNVVLYPEALRKFLKKSCYWMSYDGQTGTAELSANHGGGGQPLLTLERVSYETAVRIAADLGLAGDGDRPQHWSKWNPVLLLEHDGSTGAEEVRLEMLRLGIPHEVTYGSAALRLRTGSGGLRQPLWTPIDILEEIRRFADRYSEQLSSRP